MDDPDLAKDLPLFNMILPVYNEDAVGATALGAQARPLRARAPASAACTRSRTRRGALEGCAGRCREAEGSAARGPWERLGKRTSRPGRRTIEKPRFPNPPPPRPIR